MNAYRLLSRIDVVGLVRKASEPSAASAGRFRADWGGHERGTGKRKVDAPLPTSLRDIGTVPSHRDSKHRRWVPPAYRHIGRNTPVSLVYIVHGFTRPPEGGNAFGEALDTT
jgi:hypothetical protein